MKLVIDIDENEYKGIKSFPNANTSYPWTLHLYDAVRNATPYEERPKGEWIKQFTNGFGNKKGFCNKCGCVGDVLNNFCPNCGADMRAEQSGAGT